MGQEVVATFGYAFIFDKNIVFQNLHDNLKMTDEEKEIYEDDFNTFIEEFIQNNFEVATSTDLYTGDDYLDEIYIYVQHWSSYGKRSDIKFITDISSLILNEEELKKTKLSLIEYNLLGLEKKSGWILRSYLA